MSDNELKPIAVLRREIGESTWFDWYPIRPGCRTHIDLQKDNGMDYCEVYTRPALTDEQVRERFETWAATGIGRLSRNNAPGSDLGGYEDSHTNVAWLTWKAAIREAIGRGERG